MAYRRSKSHSLNSEVRLRNWPAGRLAQLKLFLGHLDQLLGATLAAQVEQTPNRTFSEFVPKIPNQNITVERSFTEVRLSWTPPLGLRNLLFYEIQLSATEGFFNIDVFQTADNFYVWSNLAEGTTYYIRIRVTTKDAEVGPWSETQSITTPFSMSYGLYDGTERVKRISATTGNPWSVCWERDYTSIGGNAYYSLDYDVQTIRDWGNPSKGNIEWSDVEFRWTEKGPSDSTHKQAGEIFKVTTYSSSNQYSLSGFYSFNVVTDGYTTPLNIPGTWVNPRRGTFIQKFKQLEEGTYTIRLEAKIAEHGNPANDFSVVYGTSFSHDADAQVKVKHFNIFESLISDPEE